MPLLCIYNARLVDRRSESRGGVLVGDDGRIEAKLEGGDKAAADIVIDARERLLFAGFVDAHVHMRDPGFPHKEDFKSGSTAAACAGVTTVMCMPNTNPAVDTVDGFHAARRAGQGKSFVDFTLQGAITRNNIDAIPDLWDCGISSFETLLSDAPPEMRLDDEAILVEALAAAARVDARVGIYTGCQALLDAGLGRMRKQARNDWRAFVEARDPVGEAFGVALALEAARFTGARVAIRQTSTARGFELLREAKRADRDDRIAVEATPQHLHFDESLIDDLGPLTQMVPPLRPQQDRDASIAALVDGTVDFVGSDHAPHAKEEKFRPDPWTAAGGSPGLDTIAAAVVDFGCRGVISFMRVADVLGARPAVLFGVADHKGALEPGLDGDLVLVDPEVERTVTPDHIRSKAGRSVFEGATLHGWPILTVLRGRVVAEDGRLTDDAPSGAFVARMGAAGAEL